MSSIGLFEGTDMQWKRKGKATKGSESWCAGPTSPSPSGGKHLAIGGTIILLHPPSCYVGISTGMEG